MKAKGKASSNGYGDLPAFVAKVHFMQFTGRAFYTVQKWLDNGYLPPCKGLSVKGVSGYSKGWRKADIVKWLRQHPEAIRQ